MNRNWLFAVVVVLCFCAAGCNDENMLINGDACNGKCDIEQTCYKGVCVDDEEPAATLCKKTKTTCYDETSLKICEKGEEPTKKKCKSGKKCVDGECIDVCKETKKTCLDLDTLSVCKKDQTPTEKKCEDVKANSVCVDGACISPEGDDNRPEPPVDPNEEIACDDGTICPEGYYCDYNAQEKMVCLKSGQLGDACDVLACDLMLTCQDNICKKMAHVGEPCDEVSICETELCVQGICSDYAKLYGECSETQLCPAESVCIDHQCVPTKGKCKSNRECKGDTYCCLEDSCGNNKGACMPYSQDKTYDPECVFSTKAGLFEASVQCYWKPSEYTNSTTVFNSAIVGKIHNNRGITTPLVVFVTTRPTVIRIIEPENCQTVENIPLGVDNADNFCSYNNVSIADLNGDGYMEIVTYDNGLVLYTWDESQKKHTPRRLGNTVPEIGNNTVSIHDINNDGVPEIVNTSGQVFTTNGAVSNAVFYNNSSYTTPVIADLDGDGQAEYIANNTIYRWNQGSKSWQTLVTLSSNEYQNTPAYADFGTPGSTAGSFDYTKLDGRAEIVLAGGNSLQVWAIYNSNGSQLPVPQQLMRYQFPMAQYWGYPPAVGDFNGDGKPEIGVASKSAFGVYDPKCSGYEAGKCTKQYVTWEKPTQDNSGIAGASAFDFDGDGKIEIVYGDECYTRVYDGQSGEVLFSSYRNSATVIEYPVIADVDGDGSTEIVISSDQFSMCQSSVDNSHRGVKCETNNDCYSGSCVGGLCRCTSDNQCNWQTINGSIFRQYSCLNPLSGDGNGGKVCRAIQGTPMPGVTILRDRLDRWVSSRTIWNQHAYTITNINDNGTIPKMSEWKQNFTTAGLNNFRQQRQGQTGSGVAPDITGRFTSAADACIVENGQVKMTAQVCNRGTKAVGSRMPAVFYKDSIANNNILCVSYTDDVVPMQGCREVSCTITTEVAESLSDQKIILKVNDDGKGGKTTVECNESNNTDEIVMKACRVVN